MCIVPEPSGENSLERRWRAALERPVSWSYESVTLSAALTDNQELIINRPSGEKIVVFNWDVRALARHLLPLFEQVEYLRQSAIFFDVKVDHRDVLREVCAMTREIVARMDKVWDVVSAHDKEVEPVKEQLEAIEKVREVAKELQVEINRFLWPNLGKPGNKELLT